MKKKIFEKIQYRDEIWLEDDEGNESLYWNNNWRDKRWGHEDEPDSEYNKLLELDYEYDFTDYDNAPMFWHYVIERDIYGVEKRISSSDLIVEYYNI